MLNAITAELEMGMRLGKDFLVGLGEGLLYAFLVH